MNFFVRQYKRFFYRRLYLRKDVYHAIRIQDPERVASTLGSHIKDIFWKEYRKQIKKK